MAGPWEAYGDQAKGPWDGFVATSEPTDKQKLQASKGGRYVQGVRDILDSGAQLAVNSLPDGFVSGVNKATQWVNSLPYIGPATVALGMTPATKQEINQGITQNEREYQDARKATGNEGIDWMRLGGGTATTLPLFAKVPVGSTIPRMAAIGGGTGAANSFLTNPVLGVDDPKLSDLITGNQPKDFWTEKGKQSGMGFLTGSIASPVLGGLSKVISPTVRPEVKLLQEAGITPTPGQIIGGTAQKLEDKLTSIPVLGDAITSARRAAVEDLNKAAINRALDPIGQKATNVGREGVEAAGNALSDAYDKVLPQIVVKRDAPFVNGLTNLKQLATNLPKEQADQFNSILKTEVMSRFTKPGLMSGTTFKEVESELGQLARGYKGDQSFANRKLGQALEETLSLLRDNAARNATTPEAAQTLQQINKGWANLTRVENAAGRLGSKEGVFSPDALSGAVRAMDSSVRKRQFARGNALMQDLADAGVNVLGPKYPDSGTVGRAALAGSAAAGATSPLSTAIGLGAMGLLSTPYLPIGRQLAAGLLTKRPELAEPIAELVRRVPGGLLGPAAYGLLANEQ